MDYSIDPPIPVCYCSSTLEGGTCVHSRLLKEYGVEVFNDPDGWFISNLKISFLIKVLDIDPSIILFSRERSEAEYINHFSLASSKDPHSAKYRTITSYMEFDHGQGIWKCNKDPGVHCRHIQQSKKYFNHSESILSPSGENVNTSTPTGLFLLFLLVKKSLLLTYFNSLEQMMIPKISGVRSI